MSVIPIDFGSKRAKGRFCQTLAEKLDALFTFPAKHAVSEQELRRVDEDIERCRQLMLQKQQQQRGLKLVRVIETRSGN